MDKLSKCRTIREVAWWWMGLLALCLIAFWAGLAGYWTAQREPPVRVENLHLLTQEVPAGGAVRVLHAATRFHHCQLTIERAIIDEDRVLFRLEDVYFQAGRSTVGEDSFIEETPVPIAARPGNARLRETLIHVCNPIHRFWPITQRMPDIPFVVLPVD